MSAKVILKTTDCKGVHYSIVNIRFTCPCNRSPEPVAAKIAATVAATTVGCSDDRSNARVTVAALLHCHCHVWFLQLVQKHQCYYRRDGK